MLQPSAEVAEQEQMTCGPDESQARSSWAAMKLIDFLKWNPNRKAFWESSFVLLVMSGVEMDTLRPEEAADILGVDVLELEAEVRRLKNEEKKLNHGGLLTKNALSEIKSEGCVRELGDCADSLGANKMKDQAQDYDVVDNIEERGIKRKTSSSAEWVTGEVVVHLLKRSFSMKDQFFSLDGGKPPVFVLKRCWPFYESNVTRVVKEIDEYCGFEEVLMESPEVQELLRAAQNLDNQNMEGGGYALAPVYNYSRCMLEKKADYWETGLPALLLQDVDNAMVPAEVAACQLGVTTTMVLSAVAGLKSQDKFSSLWKVNSQSKGSDTQERSGDDDDDDNCPLSVRFKAWKQKKKETKKRTTRTSVKKQKLSGPVTMQRYKQCGFGSEEDFWKENTTKDVLEKV